MKMVTWPVRMGSTVTSSHTTEYGSRSQTGSREEPEMLATTVRESTQVPDV